MDWFPGTGIEHLVQGFVLGLGDGQPVVVLDVDPRSGVGAPEGALRGAPLCRVLVSLRPKRAGSRIPHPVAEGTRAWCRRRSPNADEFLTGGWQRDGGKKGARPVPVLARPGGISEVTRRVTSSQGLRSRCPSRPFGCTALGADGSAPVGQVKVPDVEARTIAASEPHSSRAFFPIAVHLPQAVGDLYSSGRACRPATWRISSSGYGVFLLSLCRSW